VHLSSIDLPSIDLRSSPILKRLFIPGALLLLAVSVILESGIVPVSGSAVNFYYVAAFALGTLLAWRFHSSQVLLGLLTLLLAHRAVVFFSGGHILPGGPGRIAFEAVAFLLPANFAVYAFRQERGLTIPAIASPLGLLFLESVFVAVICRPGEASAPSILHWNILASRFFHWTGIPQISWLLFALVFSLLLLRFLLHGKPVESGLLWSLTAAFAALQTGAVTPVASAFLATAALILATSIIENSYLLAYHDELTALPARRAFNDALLRLKEPYAIAALDIDHFKAFNDNYGHETGDQVLRMVAARLARVSGGGVAFRVGGEEFSILFPGTSVKEALPHLELLRAEVEASIFRVRGPLDRRHARHPATDRRKPGRRRTASARPIPARSPGELSVTVSIGVAQPDRKRKEARQVVEAADKALYRAKQAGRNRIESAGPDRAKRDRIA